MIERIPIQTRDDWLAWRGRDVTGSDIAAVLGKHPDRSAARIWAEKTGLVTSTPPTRFLRYRRMQEAAAVDWLKHIRPTWDIRRSTVYLRDPGLRLGGTPDAVAVDPKREGFGIIEIKTVASHIFERDWPPGNEPEDEQDEVIAEAPVHHQLQCLTYQMLAGASWGLVLGYIIKGSHDGFLALCSVNRSEAVEQRIRDGVAQFWALTESGKQPALRYEHDAAIVSALYPQAHIREPDLDLSGSNRIPEVLKRRAEVDELSKSLKAERESIDAEIKDAIGHHEAAALPGWRITWKTQARAEHIVEAWSGRVLRVTKTRETKK